ncbi:MAG TPA: hypothetical protein VF032_19440 [Thermoleophilaceae bacterium]
MSLLDDLREAAAAVPPSHQPVGAELASIVGALVGVVEHGKDFLEACKSDLKARDAGEPATAVDKLFSPDSPSPDQPAAPSSPAAPAAPAEKTPAELESEIAALQQQLQTAQANEQKTSATVEPVEPPASGSEPPADPSASEGHA